MPQKLCYFGTDDAVREGDRVEFTSLLLRRKVMGTVVSIPNKTARELNDEKKPPDDRLIRLDNGTFIGWMYYPEELRPARRLKLVNRGAQHERTTSDELERQEAEIEEKLGLKEDVLGCALLIAIASAILVLIAVFRYGLPSQDRR